jgi:hypothetical protein
MATADVSTPAKTSAATPADMSAATTTKMTAAATTTTTVAAATRQSVHRDRGASERNRSDDNRDFVQLETCHWIYH